MWLLNMEKMETKQVIPKKAQRKTVARMKKRKIIKESNKPQFLPPPKKRN